MFDVLCPGCHGDFAKAIDYITHNCPGIPGESAYKFEEIDWFEEGEGLLLEHPYAGVERVLELHAPMNGPYDDLACKHCTSLVHKIAEAAGIIEPIYVEYPCPTRIALGEE